MIETFLRGPRGALAVLADVLRMAGLVSVAVAATHFQATDAGVLAFVLAGLVLPRFVGVPAGFDVAYCATLLVAAWSNVFDLYTGVTWWDIPVHFCCTGVMAVMVYLLFARIGMVPHPRPDASQGGTSGNSSGIIVIFTAVLGLAASALWEMVEWFGHAFISSAIYVEYNDTIADMAIGGLGAVVAGVLLLVHRTRPDHRKITSDDRRIHSHDTQILPRSRQRVRGNGRDVSLS